MKKNFLRAISLAAISLSMVFSAAYAEEDLPKATKYENGVWYEIMLVKFKPGKEWAANEFIDKHWAVVDGKIGRNVVGYDFEFGKWDQLVFFPMSGPEAVAWEMTPGEEKWFASFVEHAGGLEQAYKLMAEWDELVDETESFLVRARNE